MMQKKVWPVTFAESLQPQVAFTFNDRSNIDKWPK
jgi:hypothetical protein